MKFLLGLLYLDARGVGRPATHLQRLAERHEFGVAFDVGDEIEHFRRTVSDPTRATERGQSYQPWA